MGELLMIPEIEEFLTHINKTLPKQNKIVTTNGLFLKQNIANKLLNNHYCIQISLHASNADLHHKITGLKRENFDLILDQIRHISGKRTNKQSPYLMLIFVINTLNIEDLPNFIELAADLGVDCVRCSYMTIFKPAHLKLSCYFKQEMTNLMIKRAKQRAEELNVNLITPPVFHKKESADILHKCSDPWKNIYIDTEGAVLPCCYSGSHFGELNGTSDFLSIWNNNKYQELRSGIISGNTPEMCRYCLNNDYYNINVLNAHVSFRPEVQREILGDIIS